MNTQTNTCPVGRMTSKTLVSCRTGCKGYLPSSCQVCQGVNEGQTIDLNKTGGIMMEICYQKTEREENEMIMISFMAKEGKITHA